MVSSIVSSSASDYEEARWHQQEHEEQITSLTQRHFNFFLTGSVLWEKERRCPNYCLKYQMMTSGVLFWSCIKGIVVLAWQQKSAITLAVTIGS